MKNSFEKYKKSNSNQYLKKKFEFESILLVGLDPSSNRYRISIHSPDYNI